MSDKGIIVGCDIHQQWLLPWWWKNYSKHNSYPVAFIDFGMSEEAVSWCKERGKYLQLPTNNHVVSLENDLSSTTKTKWKERYAAGLWKRRSAWFKKPFALLHSPFSLGIWIDVDCEVRGSLDPLFYCLYYGTEIALVRDYYQNSSLSLPGEIQYNSGVIAFSQNAPILHKWVETSIKYEKELPGDQETLSRAIFTSNPALMELPTLYNWYKSFGKNKEAVIYHYCGTSSKLKLLKSYEPESAIDSLLLKQSLLSSIEKHHASL